MMYYSRIRYQGTCRNVHGQEVQIADRALEILQQPLRNFSTYASQYLGRVRDARTEVQDFFWNWLFAEKDELPQSPFDLRAEAVKYFAAIGRFDEDITDKVMRWDDQKTGLMKVEAAQTYLKAMASNVTATWEQVRFTFLMFVLRVWRHRKLLNSDDYWTRHRLINLFESLYYITKSEAWVHSETFLSKIMGHESESK